MALMGGWCISSDGGLVYQIQCAGSTLTGLLSILDCSLCVVYRVLCIVYC